MHNIKISISGLEGFTAAIDRLAGAIEAQKALIVPEGTVHVDPECVTPQEEATPKTDKKPAEKSTVSMSDVRAKFVEVAREGKKDELKELLREFGSENVSGLDESVLDDVYERLGEM